MEMHPVNAMKLSHAGPKRQSLDDIFLATRALIREITRSDYNEHNATVPRPVMHYGLARLVMRNEHTPEFMSIVHSAFASASSHVTSQEKEAVTLKNWDRASVNLRLDFCLSFNNHVVQFLQDETQIKLSGTNIYSGNFGRRSGKPIAPLGAHTPHDMQPHSPPQKLRNTLTINTGDKSGFASADTTIRNMTSATMYLVMQNMTRNGITVAREYQEDQELWERMCTHKAAVPPVLDDHFSTQFFRRLWDDVANRTAIGIMTTIEQEKDLPELPKRGIFQRIFSP